MPAIAVAPFVLKDAIFQVGTDSYEAHVSSVLFTPTYNAVTWVPITPTGAFTDQSSPTWQCAIEYAQDWTTPNSFAQYLIANKGQTKVVVFKPQGSTTGKPLFTASLIIVAGPIGGAVNTVQVGTVTLGVVGEPVKSVAP